jgi:hypothetical protein
MSKKHKWTIKVAKEEEIEVEAATQQEAENEAICVENVMMLLDDPKSKRDEDMEAYSNWIERHSSDYLTFKQVWSAAVKWAKVHYLFEIRDDGTVGPIDPHPEQNLEITSDPCYETFDPQPPISLFDKEPPEAMPSDGPCAHEDRHRSLLAVRQPDDNKQYVFLHCCEECGRVWATGEKR